MGLGEALGVKNVKLNLKGTYGTMEELYEAIKPITKWRCEHANCAMQL